MRWLTALQRKLLRDLTRLKGQVATIALVVACGIACFVSLRGNHASLTSARARYYDRERFADVFAQLERAPEALVPELAAIPGVARVQTRVVEAAMIPLPGMAEPLRARVISLPVRRADRGARLRNGSVGARGVAVGEPRARHHHAGDHP
jgi:putative ABC transport system permease protein